jgi:hypothetical protein
MDRSDVDGALHSFFLSQAGALDRALSHRRLAQGRVGDGAYSASIPRKVWSKWITLKGATKNGPLGHKTERDDARGEQSHDERARRSNSLRYWRRTTGTPPMRSGRCRRQSRKFSDRHSARGKGQTIQPVLHDQTDRRRHWSGPSPSATTSSSSNMAGLLRSTQSPGNSPKSEWFCRAPPRYSLNGKRSGCPLLAPKRTPSDSAFRENKSSTAQFPAGTTTILPRALRSVSSRIASTLRSRGSR